jgi:hypothetical protein
MCNVFTSIILAVAKSANAESWQSHIMELYRNESFQSFTLTTEEPNQICPFFSHCGD